MQTQRELFLKHLAQTSEAPLKLEIDKAEGVYLFTTDGKRLFDLISGVSVSNIGHSHPRAIDAVCKQASQYMHLMVYGEYIQYPQVRLAQRISEMLPKTLQSVYFVNSGSEAVEGALKLAKRYTGKHEIVAYKNAYHGSTHGALSVMGDEEPKRSFRPLLPAVKHIEINKSEDLNLITNNTACVIIEPIQGEGGIISASSNYLKELRNRCDEVGALLIFDEIQSGMGRTGHNFAFEKLGVAPDVLLLAKAFGGGMPLGAFISSNQIMECLTNNPPLGHITTFGGHPVSCAAALASIDVVSEEKVIDSVKKKEELFTSLLKEHPKVKGIRSSGLFMAIELGSFDNVQKTIKLGTERGFVTDWFLFCNTAIRIAPPLTITESEIEEVCSIILEVLDEI